MLHKTKSVLLASIAVGAFLPLSSAIAQVAPTEVNEEAVDAFGMERKTGRFVWSSGEIIGIGPEGARLGVTVTGVRTPPYRQYVYQGLPTSVAQLSQPTISINPVAVEFSQIPGEIYPNLNHVTIDYYGGSHTFECNSTVCHSLYLLPNIGMRPLGNGYEFMDQHGTLIYVENGYSTITFKDGRQEVYSGDGHRTNNFGYMLRRTAGGSQGNKWTAINRAIDICPTDAGANCTGLQADRYAFVSSVPTSPLSITDAAGGVTLIRWEQKTAMEGRPPTGYPHSSLPTIPQRTVRYPLGITFPGDSAESITISYNSHIENADIHDDIRVNQIVRNGVTVDYEVVPVYPYGKAVEFVLPAADNGGSYQVSDDYGWGTAYVNIGGGLAAEVGQVCGNFSNSGTADNTQTGGASLSLSSFHTNRCSGGGLISGGGGGGLGLNFVTEEAPPDEDHLEPGSSEGSQVYQLTITARIDGEIVSQSEAIRPYSREGAARRRLLWTEDGLGRRTNYATNYYDEVVAMRPPEGNWTVSAQDLRGNVEGTLAYPKSTDFSPTAAPIATAYSYIDECTDVNIAWCNRPISMTDPMGNVTNLEYNDYGQLTKEIGPASTPGAARPTVVNEYEFRTAYIKDSAGNPVAAGPPISMLIRSFTCISSATCDANTPEADMVVSEYDYGPDTGLNNLLLRGMTVRAQNAEGQMETRRTCYEYNYFGERISETLPGADLSSCPA